MSGYGDPVGVILAKKDGLELTGEQIRGVVAGYHTGDVAPEQMSALLMAVVLRGMTRREIGDWTAAMVDSGERMDWRGLRRGGRRLPTVDKHSTGGVGDKITLPLTPLVASFGVAVPQLSGRGLGYTGGTLDKLESIPGWRAELTGEQMRRQLTEVGAVVCAATAELAPADGKLYALRDITGTVAAIPLLASSIMSKKIAEGTAALVLDVKVGSGAFLKTLDEARELAETMVELGTDSGMATSALLTDMSAPLGRSAGNAVEVTESLEVLAGGGPDDVVELTVRLATEMLTAAGIHEADAAEQLRNGRAMDTWRTMIAGQGGDPEAPLPHPRHTHEMVADTDGYLVSLDALGVGRAAWLLGAGRTRPGQSVSSTAGVTWHVDPGDRIRRGQRLLTLHTDDEWRLPDALESLTGAVEVGQAPPPDRPASRVLGRIGGA